MSRQQSQEIAQEMKTGTIGKTKYGLPIDEQFSLRASEDRIRKTSEALKQNGFIVQVVDTPHDAKNLVESLLPLDKDVFTGASETVRLSGLDEAINGAGSRFRSLRKEIAKLDRATQFREQVKMGATPDIIVGSVHAITESGQVFVASASGSQLGPYSAGAEKVIWVVGSQKLVSDFDDAMRRLQTYAYPMEDARMHEAMKKPSTIAKILILNREVFPGRTTVVIVREPIGF